MVSASASDAVAFFWAFESDTCDNHHACDAAERRDYVSGRVRISEGRERRMRSALRRTAYSS